MTLRVPILLGAALISVATLSAQPIEGRYIVRLKPGADAQAVARTHGVQPDYVYTRVLNGMAGFVPPGLVQKLANDPNVESITADHAVYAIAKPGTGGGTTTTAEVVPAGVVRIGAYNSGRTGMGVGVAVLDTGLDFNHADLKPNLALQSFNAFDPNLAGQDDHGHGTHVGGTIAAVDNEIDVVGVAPQAKLYAVKVLNAQGSGADSAIIAGLDWVVVNANSVTPKIRVVNMSLGRDAYGPEVDGPLKEAIGRVTAANIAVVVAAGNDPTLEARDQVPAGFPKVIATASTTAKDGTNKSKRISMIIHGDTASYFTSDGALATDANGMAGVTISAPGAEQENIDAAGFIQSVGILSLKVGGGTARMSGTSMASPHVAGVAALLWEKNAATGITPEQIRSVLRKSALNAGTAPLPSPTRSYTYDGEREGIVDVPGALSAN